MEASHKFLKISSIEEGFVILKNGGVRLILMCTPLNFALKSENEQEAIIFEFQNFLNSLEFPIQIVVQSKRVDLTTYLQSLELRKNLVNNPLLERQIVEYVDFIKKLIRVANIMDKRFFVVLSWQNPKAQVKGLFAGLRSKNTLIPLDEASFQQAKAELMERANVVASELASMGVQAIQLNTKELIELFYQSYNPELAVDEKLIDAGIVTNPIVSKEETKNV